MVLLNDTRVDRHHGCDAVIRTILDLGAASGLEVVATAPAHRNWREDAAVVAAMEAADLVLVNGEGTIHHDRPAGRWLLEAGAWAADRGIAAALINMTWQENSAAYADLLRSFDLVAVRESLSEAEVRALGVECLRVPDLAMYHSWPAPAHRDGVGFTDSVLGSVAIQVARLRRAGDGQALTMFHSQSALEDLKRTLQQYRAGGAGLSPAAIGAALRTVAADRQGRAADLEGFARRVAGLRLLVTGRFHALILAFAAGTPVLALGSNTHKIEATLRDAGLEAFRMTAPERIDRDLIERASRWHGDEAARLAAFVDEGRERMQALFRRLRALAP